MTALLRFLSFPLLAKELTETAARRRTYVLRVLYGVLLFAVFAALSPRWLWRSEYDLLAVMGEGSQMLEIILGLQFAGIGLFLPAMMCGRIAEEKERDSLALLFLTDLGPWSIVLQKYLGGLVPMLSFLLLAMPLAAIAYAFGGVETEALAAGLYALLLAGLQVGALALLCSAWCRTTVSALVSTYLLGVGFYLGPVLLLALYRFLTIQNLGPDPTYAFLAHIPVAFLWYPRSAPADDLVLRSIPILVSIAVFLWLTRFFLVRRAFLPPSGFLLRLFRRLDGVMQRANRITGNVLLARRSHHLPGDDPIAWREMTRKALGKVHYLVRILICIEVPVLGLCALAPTENYRGQSEMLSVVAAIVGTLAILALSVQAANIIVAERVQQTLEVLLTTPLTAREIVAQKARVLRRFVLVLAIPLLTIFAAEFYLEWDAPRHVAVATNSPAVYLAGVLLSVGLVLPLVAWLSLWIGLKMRTRFKAILTALAVVVAWCVVPIIAAEFIEDSFSGIHLGDVDMSAVLIGAICLLSPLAVPILNEDARLHTLPPLGDWSDGPSYAAWLVLAACLVIHGTCLLLFRHLALSRADRYLRR